MKKSIQSLPVTLADLVFATLGHVPTAQETDLRERLRQLIADSAPKYIDRDGGFFPAYQTATVHQAELQRAPGQKPLFDPKFYFSQNEPLRITQKLQRITDAFMPALLRHFPGTAQLGGVSLAPACSKARGFKLLYTSHSDLAHYLTTLFTLKPSKYKPLLHLQEPYASLLLREEGQTFGRPLEWRNSL